MNKKKAKEIVNIFKSFMPDTICELDHKNAFELLVATMLSAQTTDKRVNMVTKVLFEKYKEPKDYINASYNDIYSCIKELGLAKSKANNLLLLANMLVNDYNSIVPDTIEELTKLPGVGRKTANVVLAVWFKKAVGIAVDTHVYRVSLRLGFRKEDDSVYECEKKLMFYLDKEDWIYMHQVMVIFGRYNCKSSSPDCKSCKLIDYCLYNKNKKRI